MSQHDQDTQPKRKRRGTSVMVWVLMIMLIAGLGGFGVTNFGGSITSIGTVGGRSIDVNDYARALKSEMDAFSAQIGQPITLQEATALGLDARVRQQLLTGAALDDTTDRIPLSVGDATLAAEIQTMPAFQGAGGAFDKDTYDFQLRNAGLKPAQFEARMRDELARNLMSGAVAGGFVAPAAMTDTLHAHIAEKRGFSLLRLSEADLATPPATPDDAALRAYYDANIDQFTAPEAKRINYVALTPEDLAATMPADEAAIRTLYDERIKEYVQPERRLVERLVFPSEAEAQAAKARIDGGETFETIVAERQLKLMDIDLGDVSREELGAAADAVFALDEGAVSAPLMTDLGPALFRVNAVLAAQEVTFDEARPDLTVEYQRDAARRAIGDKVEQVEDALAGGATLAELEKEFGMKPGTVDFSAKTEGPMAAYPAFRTAAEKLQAGDFPEVFLLDDGGIAALEFVEQVPAAPIPFDKVQPLVAEAARSAALRDALKARAEEILTKVTAGESLSAFGIVSTNPGITRDGFVEQVPADFMTTLFAMDAGAMQVIASPELVGILRLDTVIPAEAGEDAAALKGAIAAQIEQALAQDAFSLFAVAQGQKAGLSLDQAAIDAVHAGMR